MPRSFISTTFLLLSTAFACTQQPLATPTKPEPPRIAQSPDQAEVPSSPPPAMPPASAEQADPWVTISGLDFGPPGATLRRTNTDVRPRSTIERQLVAPGKEGPQIFPMNEGGEPHEDGPCTRSTMGSESIFLVDTDGDDANELFVAWTWATGVGHNGARDNLQVCGWRWTGTQLVYLSELSRDLTNLGLRDAQAVGGLPKRQAEAGTEWKAATTRARPTNDPRTRVYDVGELTLTMTQTGAYFVEVEVSSEPSTQRRRLEGLTYADLDSAAQRTHDFLDSWELRTVGGEPNCCAFDLAPDAEGAPEITRAWTQAGSTYLILRQTQSKVENDCAVLRVFGGSISTEGYDCDTFLEQRSSPVPPAG